MRRSLTCAALALAAGAPPPALAAPPSASVVPPTGALYVSTLPAGADVYVDGTYVGRSPVLVDALGAGRHGVTMTKAGWSLRETDVVVPAGAVAFENDRLAASGGTPASGFVLVRGVGDDARVSLDGQPLAPRGPAPASAGPHRLTIRSGATLTVRTITVFPETTTDVLARDAAPAPDRGGAAVVASLEEWLPDAVLTISGKKITLRYAGHDLEGRLGDGAIRVDGEIVSYQGAPEMIGGKLYLPLALLQRLSGDVERSGKKIGR